MRYLILLIASFLFSACGGGDRPATVDLRLKGEVVAGGTTFQVDVDEWELACEDCDGHVSGGGTDVNGAIGAAGVRATPPPDGMEWLSAGVSLKDGLRVGPWATVNVSVKGQKFEESTFSDPFPLDDGVVVERIRYLGEDVAAWELTVRAKGAFENSNGRQATANLTYDGVMTAYPRCRRAGGVQEEPMILCGSYGGRLTEPAIDECPPELTAAYVPGLKVDIDEAVGEMRIGDEEPMPCVHTQQNSFVCGKTLEGVKAAGCTWRVDVLATDRLHVFGKANEGCAFEKPYCTTVFKRP